MRAYQIALVLLGFPFASAESDVLMLHTQTVGRETLLVSTGESWWVDRPMPSYSLYQETLTPTAATGTKPSPTRNQSSSRKQPVLEFKVSLFPLQLAVGHEYRESTLHKQHQWFCDFKNFTYSKGFINLHDVRIRRVEYIQLQWAGNSY